jgi:glyoxylase-like metal-dependent hydrolase (beta-lactamase superfamily II)
MRITQNVHALKIDFPSAVSEHKTIERFVYVYFVFGKKICMIDAGVSAACPAILDYIKSAGRRIEEVDWLIHTHCHPDHIGCSPAIKKKSACQVAAHEFAKPWIEDVDLQYRERPTGTFYTLVSGSVGVDRLLNDGDRLDLGEGQSLRVLHTPGHSRDSVSFYHERDRVLFSGDTIPVPDERPVYEDVLALIGSIRRLQAVKELSVLCSSWLEPQHGENASAEMEKSIAYMQRLHEIVRRTKSEFPAMDRAGLCSRVLEIIGQPKIPNVIKTIEAHLDASHIENMLVI